MDWSKAKNYTIIFLIFLNIVLFFCNLRFNKRYELTDESIESVKAVLDKKNIKTGLCKSMPVEYNPIEQLSFDEYSYDEIDLQKIFFGGQKLVKRTSDFDKTVIEYENKTISVEGDTVFYNDPHAFSKEDFGQGMISQICEEKAERVSEFFDGFKFYGIEFYGEHYAAEYIQEYKGIPVFGNYIRFKAYENGSLSAELKYFPVKGQYGEKAAICSADEALFVFSQKAKEICGTEIINVVKIEKGWYSDDFEGGGKIISMPYYRIKVKEREEPFFVNAYNRTLKE